MRKEKLKEALHQIHEGKPYQEVKEVFKEILSSATAGEIAEIEQASLNLSGDEQNRFYAAVKSLSAIELLFLAENIKDTAKYILYGGMLSVDVKKEIRRIFLKKDSLILAPQPSLMELEELDKLL